MKLDYIKDRLKWFRCGITGHQVRQTIFTNQYALDLCVKCGWARVEPMVSFANADELIEWLQDES